MMDGYALMTEVSIAQDMCYEGHNGFEKWVKEEVKEDE